MEGGGGRSIPNAHGASALNYFSECSFQLPHNASKGIGLLTASVLFGRPDGRLWSANLHSVLQVMFLLFLLKIILDNMATTSEPAKSYSSL